MLRLLLLCLPGLLPLPAMAIYKCESNRVISYSDTPCSSGKSSTLDTSFSSDRLDTPDAQQQLNRQKTELKQLETARHKREASEEKERKKLAKAHAVKQKKCAGLALRQKWSEEDAVLANGKSSAKAKLKARRMAEKYQLECGT